MDFANTRPDLYDWTPSIGDLFYQFDGENVKASYNDDVGVLDSISTFHIFYIKKFHYKKYMTEIVNYMNYFTKFYDLDKEAFMALMLMKYTCDSNTGIPQKEFINKVSEIVLTEGFIRKCKLMACDLYKLNINTDSSGKFNNTPKITNNQAYQIVAISICFKLLIPLMLHFSNINTNFDPKVKTEYIKWFNKLFTIVIKKFEEDDVPFYTSLCKFVTFRGERLYRNNPGTFNQKKMIRGDTIELYNENLIREVVCVKTLYKLDYRQSCVSFIDGVIAKFNGNYLKENYTSTPYEMESADTSSDNDDSMSHAESIEQANYKRDESSILISDVNIKFTMDRLREWYGAFEISKEELDFYMDNYYPNEINTFLLDNFFTSKFDDPYAVANLNKEDKVYLIVCLKKIFQYYHMNHFAHLVTAKTFQRIKTNIIKNAKFIDEFKSDKIYQDVIHKKYSFLLELDLKVDPILKYLGLILNNTYEIVDFNPELNGYKLEHLDYNAIARDYKWFLSII